MRGAVAAGRLTVVRPPRVKVTCIGTSPAPASEAGSVNSMMSNPCIFVFGLTLTIPVPEITVVPTVTMISLGIAKRTPVTVS
ncbi:MAG TPA: hypothetical protein VK893_10070 [Pyrinomonadaceae bacterium]|nr:hypothetical protein [Pyrinomonadaceae bacterium]